MQQQPIKEKQAVHDGVVLATGSIDELFNIALLNEISITAIMPAGSVVNYAPVVERAFIVNELAARVAKPASIDEGTGIVLPGGIGYMQIGTTFRIS